MPVHKIGRPSRPTKALAHHTLITGSAVTAGRGSANLRARYSLFCNHCLYQASSTGGNNLIPHLGITPEYPTHPTVLGLGLGLGLGSQLGLGLGIGLGLGLGIMVRD